MTVLFETTVGPRNAYTDGKTGLRFYRWGDKDYPSVTSIRRMAGLPFFLHEWTISQVVNRAIEEYATLGVMLTRDRRPRERVLEKNRLKEAKSWLRKAAIEERDRAADLGTRVHDAAAKGISILEADPDVAAKLHQFYDWLETSEMEIVAVEKQCWNLTLGYAGTFDFLAIDKDGAVWMVDLKTGKSTFTEHAIQLIGYSMAEFVGEDNVIDPHLTDLLLNLNGIAILHLADESWKWQEIKPSHKLFRAFRGLLSFSTFAYEFQKIDDLVAEQEEGAA